MDVRWDATILVSGLVLPALTVLVALDTAIRFEIPPQLTFALLLAVPLVAIAMTYATALYSDISVPLQDRLPYGGPRQFEDEVPGQFHDAFAAETLDAPVAAATDGPDRVVTASLVYLISIPVYTLTAWLLLFV